MMKNIKEAINLIRKSKTIVIAGHINPDGDCIGSLLSLGIGLKSLGKTVEMISSDGVPERYRLLPYAKYVKKESNKIFDLAIAVDCNCWEMLGKALFTFKKAKSILEIDHHEFRRTFGNLELIDNKASAVGEIIYVLLNKLKVSINPFIAENILTSILVETNSFRLPNISPHTFEICAKLLHRGVNFSKLVENMYWVQRKQAIILSGLCLSRCKFLYNNKIAWAFVEEKDFRTVKGKDEDVDAVADQMRDIKGVEVVVLFREKDLNTIRVSLRSKHINVAVIAEKYNGGGHFDVAGCHIPNTPLAKDKLLRDVKKILNKK